MSVRLLKNPNHVLTDCDNIDNTDGQRMATVLGKHVFGYDKAASDIPVDRVLGVDAQGDIRWTANAPGVGEQSDWAEENPEAPSFIRNKPQTKQVVAGDNITITEGDDSYTIAATGIEYTAGTNVSISEDNVISAVDTYYAAGTGLDMTAGNTFNVYNPVPDSPGTYYQLQTSSYDHNGFLWKAIMRTRFTGQSQNATITATDLTNGYVDVKVDWDLDNQYYVDHNTPEIHSNEVVCFLHIDDAYFIRSDTAYSLQSQVSGVESGIWNDSYPSFYGCDLFGTLSSSELARTGSSLTSPVRKLGMQFWISQDMSGPAFRIRFDVSNTLQAGDVIVLGAKVAGLYLPETQFI